MFVSFIIDNHKYEIFLYEDEFKFTMRPVDEYSVRAVKYLKPIDAYKILTQPTIISQIPESKRIYILNFLKNNFSEQLI